MQLIIPPEVVDHQEAAIEQILTQLRPFLRREREGSRLDDVDEGVVEEPLVGQLHIDWHGVDLERRQLLQTKREVQVAIGKIGEPSRP